MRAFSIGLVSLLLVAPITAEGAGRAAGVLGFFTWSPRVPEEVRSVLDLYERNRLVEAAAAAERVLAREPSRDFRDEVLLVRSLAFADLGWRSEAEASFQALLEAEEASPYYPLALLGLIESYHDEGRADAVAEAYGRYWERVWAVSSRRNLRLQNFLDSYGELRAPSTRLTAEEAALFAKPARLSEEMASRKERPTERALYLAGLDLFRAREYTRSLEALERIGLVSLYAPYALYTAAQDCYALGDADAAQARVSLLLRYPPLTEEQHALADRAGLFLAEMLFDAGRAGDAAAAARRLTGDGRYALAARLLRAEISLASDEPSLAVAFYGDLEGKTLGPRLDAERALGLGEAYSKLGDFASATSGLKGASDELAHALAALEPPQADASVEHLRTLAEADARAARDDRLSRRKRIVAGMRRVFAFKGPMNLGKLTRVVFASHRNTVLGEPVYDLRMLAESEVRSRPEGGAGEGPWLRYLDSPKRSRIEAAEALRLALASPGDDSAGALAVLDTLLALLEERFFTGAHHDPRNVGDMVDRLSEALGDRQLGPIDVTSGAPLATDVVAFRRRLLESLANRTSIPAVAPELLSAARRLAEQRLQDVLSSALAELVAAEAQDLRHVAFNVQAELSEAMRRQNAAMRSSETLP